MYEMWITCINWMPAVFYVLLQLRSDSSGISERGQSDLRTNFLISDAEQIVQLL